MCIIILLIVYVLRTVYWSLYSVFLKRIPFRLPPAGSIFHSYISFIILNSIMQIVPSMGAVATYVAPALQTGQAHATMRGLVQILSSPLGFFPFGVERTSSVSRDSGRGKGQGKGFPAQVCCSSYPRRKNLGSTPCSQWPSTAPRARRPCRRAPASPRPGLPPLCPPPRPRPALASSVSRAGGCHFALSAASSPLPLPPLQRKKRYN